MRRHRGHGATAGMALAVLLALSAPALAGTAESHGREAYVAVFQQGYGIILDVEPSNIDADRNPLGAYSSLDTWVTRDWRGWGNASTSSPAVYWFHSTSGPTRRYSSLVTLTGLRRCGDRAIYTQIIGRFTGAVPPGLSRTLRERPYRLPAGTCR